MINGIDFEIPDCIVDPVKKIVSQKYIIFSNKGELKDSMIKQLSWKVAWFLVGFPLFRFWMRNDRMRNWFAWNSPSVRSSNFFCKCEVAVVKVWNAFDGHYHRYHLATFLIKPFTVREFARNASAASVWFSKREKVDDFCHQTRYLLKWKKEAERSFPFPARASFSDYYTTFPISKSRRDSSRIVPKKVVVVVESIDFTWSYLSLSYCTATASPNFSLALSWVFSSWKQRDHLAPFSAFDR